MHLFLQVGIRRQLRHIVEEIKTVFWGKSAIEQFRSINCQELAFSSVSGVSMGSAAVHSHSQSKSPDSHTVSDLSSIPEFHQAGKSLTDAVNALLSFLNEPVQLTSVASSVDILQRIVRAVRLLTGDSSLLTDDTRKLLLAVRKELRKAKVENPSVFEILKNLEFLIGEDFFKKQIEKNAAILEKQLEEIKKKAQLLKELKTLQAQEL